MRNTIFLILCIVSLQNSFSQDKDSLQDFSAFPSTFLKKVSSYSNSIQNSLQKKTLRSLKLFSKAEKKIRKKLKGDSSLLRDLYSKEALPDYNALYSEIANDTITGNNNMTGKYYPYIDSLQSTLAFLKNYPDVSLKLGVDYSTVLNTLNDFQRLKEKFRSAEKIQQILRQRSEQLQRALFDRLKIPSYRKGFAKLQGQAFYYTEQLKSYKELLNDPDKAFTAALQIINKIPAFKSFVRKHSFLSGIFNTPNTEQPLEQGQGLQSRQQVLSIVQTRLGTSFNRAQSFSSGQIQNAQGEVNRFRDRLLKRGSTDGDLMEGDAHYKKNNQRTKTFLKRIEYGINVQTVRSNNYFPITTDIAFTAGYKLNDNSTIGFGISYKAGWGKGWNSMKLTHEGIGLRSFIDMRLRGQIFVSGGFEQNYQTPFSNLQQIKNFTNWQESGLLGLSRIIQVKGKWMKQAKVQVLWDFLSYNNNPRSDALKFRVGYTF